MSSAVSLRDELRHLIDELSDEQVELLIDQVNNLLDPDELTPEEEAAVREGDEQIARGDFVWADDLFEELGI